MIQKIRSLSILVLSLEGFQDAMIHLVIQALGESRDNQIRLTSCSVPFSRL